jgi:SAM-dependent methyltransferase
VSVWNDAHFTHSLANASWMANVAVLAHLNERATGDPVREWLNGWARHYFVGERLRVLVLGCGEGWLERGIAGWPFVAHIDAVDFAADAVARARELSSSYSNISYDVVDLNRDELPRDTYDVILAHQVLHHIENLEHAYAQLDGALRADGTLILNEYVGPRRFQFSDDVLTLMNALLRCLPPRLRMGGISGAVYETRERPGEEMMIAHDPTEAVRSDELLAFTARTFDILDQRDLGGAVLQHLLYDIAGNFRWDAPRERAMVELLCTFEGMLVDAGQLPSDFVLVAARKRTSRLPRTAYRRELPPRPMIEADRDPLWRSIWTAVATPPLSTGGYERAVALPPQSRLLRIALASTQVTRRNLFNESPLAARLDRLLAKGDPWQWTLARYVTAEREDNEDTRAIKSLLETFAVHSAARATEEPL